MASVPISPQLSQALLCCLSKPVPAIPDISPRVSPMTLVHIAPAQSPVTSSSKPTRISGVSFFLSSLFRSVPSSDHSSNGVFLHSRVRSTTSQALSFRRWLLSSWTSALFCFLPGQLAAISSMIFACGRSCTPTSCYEHPA